MKLKLLDSGFIPVDLSQVCQTAERGVSSNSTFLPILVGDHYHRCLALWSSFLADLPPWAGHCLPLSAQEAKPTMLMVTTAGWRQLMV